ncbi:uncharacterized protein LOC111381078 isoform X2 [Olea europaea var. sylvestris]|uniref:uncharacterized protein LOC111381078 isoform X2 n=1 Tax=Olea europaea var. sylvestris TaxID=158386 RepID=UPI000C1D6D2B|nr:uncharacterized protein LOC111381078 isoform X2 [Olea europaea var. sylvestris]
MACRGFLSRSLMSTARASAFRSSPPLAARRIRPPPSSAPRRFSFSNPRTFGELGCVQSLIPLHNMAGVRLTSYLATNVRACCELSHGGLGKMGDVSSTPRHSNAGPDAILYLKVWVDQHTRCSNI